jgi:prevent-host-death family protein
MNTTNISYTRNHLSELIDRVKEGESVLIMDRNRPVARLEPAAGPSSKFPEWKASLVRRGVLRPATHKLDVRAFLAMPESRPVKGGDILKVLLSEREDGR